MLGESLICWNILGPILEGGGIIEPTVACVFRTDIMEEVNTAFIRILQTDRIRYAAEIIKQAAGPLNLSPLKFAQAEQLQGSLLVIWEAEEFDIDQMEQALTQVLLIGPPYMLTGIGPFGSAARAVPQICLTWENGVQEQGLFTVETRASRRQSVLEQKASFTSSNGTELACIFETNAIAEANTDHLNSLVFDYKTISDKIAEQATGILPVDTLIQFESVDQFENGMLVYWVSDIDLPTMAQVTDQLLLNPKPYTLPGFGPLLTDALAQPQVCAFWVEEVEDVNLIIFTRANIRGTKLPPLVLP